MKRKNLFECIECGYQSPKYYGKCPQCQVWNSMVEITENESDPERQATGITPFRLKDIDEPDIKRNKTGLDEFDRVLGGGIVPESVILIGGEPGVGKSTLLLQVSGILAKKEKKVLYFSGEESVKLKSEPRG
jgi:DNA repair protein RadA/Sms